MSGYSLLFLYIYCLVLRLTHSAITTESLCVRFMAILCPSTAIYHLLFSFLLLFFLCYVGNTPVCGDARDGYHTLDINSLLPKSNCSAPVGGEVSKPQNLVFPCAYIYIYIYVCMYVCMYVCIAFKTIS